MELPALLRVSSQTVARTRNSRDRCTKRSYSATSPRFPSRTTHMTTSPLGNTVIGVDHYHCHGCSPVARVRVRCFSALARASGGAPRRRSPCGSNVLGKYISNTSLLGRQKVEVIRCHFGLTSFQMKRNVPDSASGRFAFWIGALSRFVPHIQDHRHDCVRPAASPAPASVRALHRSETEPPTWRPSGCAPRPVGRGECEKRLREPRCRRR